MIIRFSSFSRDPRRQPHEQSFYWSWIFVGLLGVDEPFSSFKSRVKTEWDISLLPETVTRFTDITGVEIGDAEMSLILLRFPPQSILDTN